MKDHSCLDAIPIKYDQLYKGGISLPWMLMKGENGLNNVILTVYEA